MHQVLAHCAQQKFLIQDISIPDRCDDGALVDVRLRVNGRLPVQTLMLMLGELDGVSSVRMELLDD